MRSFQRKCITLIHVVNLCIWPGQIPSGNAICPTCSNKYSRNLVKLNIPADVREMERLCLKISKTWTTHSWQTAEWQHMTQYIICAMLYSFGICLVGKWEFLLWKYSRYILPKWLECFYSFFLFLYQLVCFLAFSHLSSLTRLYPTPLVDVFFTDDLLWISNLQCSDCYRQQQCFSGAVKAVLPPCTAWKCDTSIPCSCQSIEEKVD